MDRRKNESDKEKEKCGVRVLGHGDTCMESETLPRRAKAPRTINLSMI